MVESVAAKEPIPSQGFIRNQAPSTILGSSPGLRSAPGDLGLESGTGGGHTVPRHLPEEQAGYFSPSSPAVIFLYHWLSRAATGPASRAVHSTALTTLVVTLSSPYLVTTRLTCAFQPPS